MQSPRDADPVDYPVTDSVIGNGSGLAGAYSLDTSRSENTDQIVDQANLSDANRRDLESKLVAPAQITLQIRGNQVTLGSSNSSPVTFVADGRETSERDSSGRTVRVRATLKGDELRMSSIGGDTDYTIIFTPQENGRSLKVTRRVTVDYLPHTVFADSFYTRTSAFSQTRTSDPDDRGYSSNDPADRAPNSGTYGGSPRTYPGRTGDHIVPNGTIITGLLENEIDTKVSQNNDRFRLTVQSPAEFRGAVLEGYLTGVGRSGQISGRSNVTFNFERITLRNGQAYDFAGFLQSIRDQNGKTVRVDTEGTARGDSQTKETIKRGGIGAGIGAIIGAIAGGGKGAAIGAIIGGGAGAGSVVVQGRDDLHLMKGSILTIQSSSPVASGLPRDN